MSETLSQSKMIGQHLLEGKSITPIEALELYGCFRLSAIIFKLKEAGMDIAREMIYNGRKRYAKYSLRDEDDNS